MSRDSNGPYSLPTGNPVTPGTPIEADWANPTMDDVAAALTDSLSRSGLGGMLVPFKNTDGTKIAPGMTWANEPSSGWYRKAQNEFWYSVGNDDVFQITKNGIAIAPGKTAIGISSKIVIQDAEPTGVSAGEQWFESDDGGLYMRYQNPDLTYTWIQINMQGGDFIPTSEKGAALGVATLDSTGKVPAAQLPPSGDSSEIGSIVYRHTPSSKQLVCNGQTVAKATYPDLWTYAQPYLTSDQTTNPGLFVDVDASNFKVPNLVGQFLRVQGGGSGALGAQQAIMSIAHTHNSASDGSSLITTTVGNITAGGAIGGNTGVTLTGPMNNLNAGTSGSENRPANVALLACIRALP